MVMKALRDGAKGGISKFILFGFLVLATGGLVFTDVGGFFRGGVSSSDVASAGKEKISAQHFDRILRRTLRRAGMSPQQAYTMGYTTEVLNSEIRTRLFSRAASDAGIDVGDDLVRAQIQSIVKPMLTDGQTYKEVLTQILSAQGMSERELIASISTEIRNGFLNNAIASGFSQPSQSAIKALYASEQERRTIDYVLFPDSEVEASELPSDDVLKQLYEKTKEQYAMPEMRSFKIITLNTEALEKTLDISKESIQSAYEDNIDIYQKPKSWVIDQALLPTQEQAQNVYKAAKAGASIKAAVNSVTGNQSAYLGEKDVAEDGLMEELKEDIINAQSGDLLVPKQTPLGYHIVAIEQIKEPHTQPLEDVQDTIKAHMIDEQLIDQQYEMANLLDDILAGGASLEDAAQQVEINITPLPPVNQYGQDKAQNDALVNYTNARKNILESGLDLNVGETSAIFETQDGTFMAVHLSAIEEKKYEPFSEAQSYIAEKWVDDTKNTTNQVRVNDLLKKVQSADTSLKSLAQEQGKTIKTLDNIDRQAQLLMPLLQRTSKNMFDAPARSAFVIDTVDGFAIARVKDVILPTIDEESSEYVAFKSQYIETLQNEAFVLFIQSQQNKYGARINQNLLDQMYAPSESDY